MNKDYYAVLGVTKNATAEDIKKAYRKLALEFHPDRGGGPESEKKFKEANEAYQILSDPQKKATYDQFGSDAFSGSAGGFNQGFRSGGFGFSGFGGQSESDFGFGGIGDIFDEFFGQTLSQVQAEIRITPAQATLGDTMILEINGEKIEFKIPPGTQAGTSFRFHGKGKAYRGSKKGDLILTVNIEVSKNLNKEQRELWQKLKEYEDKKQSWWR